MTTKARTPRRPKDQREGHEGVSLAEERPEPPSAEGLHTVAEEHTAGQKFDPQYAGVPEVASAQAPMRKRRGKRTKVTTEVGPKVEIPIDLLTDSQKMNYVLLLALLSRLDGHAELQQTEFDIAEGEYNILFAKSLDGTKLVVSIVSAQSGILKAPEKEKTWPQQRQEGYRPPPTVKEFEEEIDRSLFPNGRTDPREMLAAIPAEETPQDQFLRKNTPESTAQARATLLPFAVGDRPETAAPIDLGAYTQAGRISRKVAEEEAEAAARVEQEDR